MKLLFSLLFSIIGLNQLPAQHFFSSLPLLKGHLGDTTIPLTQAFSIYDRVFHPSTNMYVHWNQANTTFNVYGDAQSTLENSSTHFSFGLSTNAQLQLSKDSALLVYDPKILDTFRLSGQPFLGISEQTHLNYDPKLKAEIIYGMVSMMIDGVPRTGRMGTATTPGVVLHSGFSGDIWLHLQDQVSLRGLDAADASKTDIILKRSVTDPSNTFYGHGSWYVDVTDVIQLATFGNGTDPGFIVKNGIVDSVQMTVKGGGVLFGVLPVVDDFTLSYNHTKKQYAISGTVILGIPFGGVANALGAKYAPSFEIDAGNDGTAGFLLNLSTKKFTVEDARFILKSGIKKSKSQLGGFKINELGLQVKNNQPDSIFGKVTIPPGFSVEAAFGFTLVPAADPLSRFHIHSIDIIWETENPTQAIPLGTTGFKLVKIEGGITNLDNPKDLTLIADLGMTYGAPFEIDLSALNLPVLSGKKEVYIGYLEGEAQLSSGGLSIKVFGDLGALFFNGNWMGTLGSMELDLDLDWGNSYSVKGSLSCLTPPNDIIDANILAQFNQSGDIDAQASLTLFVPHDIPIIGGKKLANAEGVIRHKQNNPKQSYAAGWVKINMGFDHVNVGAKVNFSNGVTSKIGAAEEKAIVKQVASDLSEHPVINGKVQTDWYSCQVNHHFTLETDRPVAYLQNQLIFDKKPFERPTSPYDYLAPLSASLQSPSGFNDLKNLIPPDPSNLYYNYNQTTVHDNVVNLDMSKSNVANLTDTVQWITVNTAAESYSSIDWVKQPGVLLTPGEYVLNVAGYCNVNSGAFTEDKIHYSVSPVYPRPTISLSVNQDTKALTVDYSAYLTDSTVVSIYWDNVKSPGGRTIAHLNYYNGTAIGDSTYRWTLDWDPGILSQSTIYVFAVIDDHINSAVYSAFDSVSYSQEINCVVTNGTAQVQLILDPADSTRDNVVGLVAPSGVSNAVNFGFYNVPSGLYSIQVYSPDSTYTFEMGLDIDHLDGDAKAIYHSPEWITNEIDVHSWDNGILHVGFYMVKNRVSLYGYVTDENGNEIALTQVYMLNTQDSVLQVSTVYDQGFLFRDQPSGFVNLAVVLPIVNNNHHWSPTTTRKFFNELNFYGHALYLDSININNITKALQFDALSGPQGPIFQALDGNTALPVEDVVVTLQLADGTGPTLFAVTNQYGLAHFTSEGISTFTNYIFRTSWPEPYTELTASGQTFQWTGTTDPSSVLGKKK